MFSAGVLLLGVGILLMASYVADLALSDKRRALYDLLLTGRLARFVRDP
jgi:hypothetical protein